MTDLTGKRILITNGGADYNGQTGTIFAPAGFQINNCDVYEISLDISNLLSDTFLFGTDEFVCLT